MLVNDVYQIVNALIRQSTGRDDFKVVDTSSFTRVGQLAIESGAENLMNAISTVIGRTIFSVRPYKSKLDIMRVTPQRWGYVTRKISYLHTGYEASNDHNTDLSPTQLNDGNSIDMYKIAKPKAMQLNFYGTNVLQKHITRFRDQLSVAFHNESEFMQFWDGVMTAFSNEIELGNESKARATLLNFIGGLYEMGTSVVDLTALYNQTMGTNYTRQQLLTAQLESFMKFLAGTIQNYSNLLTDMTNQYHANITGYEQLDRHSPKQKQKMIMYEPFMITAQANVFSSLFNPKYLNIGDYEGVNFWQNPKNPTAVNVTPNILDVTNGNQKKGTEQNIPYVIGLLYDEEALGILPQFDYASTTPFNSAGGYYNMYLHWRFNSYNDFTENAVLFVMGDGGQGQRSMYDIVESIDSTVKNIDGTTAAIDTTVDMIEAHAASINLSGSNIFTSVRNTEITANDIYTDVREINAKTPPAREINETAKTAKTEKTAKTAKTEKTEKEDK